jgi:hypothetical protein
MTEAWQTDPVVAAPDSPPVPQPAEATAAKPTPAPAPSPGPAAAQPGDYDKDPRVLPLSDMPTNQSGAPLKWRLAVDLAGSPQDKLATLRGLQVGAGGKADAEWVNFGAMPAESVSAQTGTGYQQDGSPGRLHLVYTNPKTHQREVFNPQGFDIGDLPGLAVGAARFAGYMPGFMAGGAAGAAGATAALGPEAAPAGFALGASAGGAAADQAVGLLGQHALGPLLGTVSTETAAEEAKRRLAEAGWVFGASLMGEALSMARLGGSQAFRNWRQAARYRPPGSGRPGVIEDLASMAREQGKPMAEGISGALPFASKSVTFRGPFQAAAKAPIAGDTINEALDNTLGVIRAEADKLHLQAGGVKTLGAGTELVQKGIGGYAKATQAAQKQLENRVEKLVGSKTQVEMTHTYDLIKELESVASRGTVPIRDGAGSIIGDKEVLRASAGGVLPAEFRNLLADIMAENGRLPFDYVRRYSEDVGERVGMPQVLRDTSAKGSDLTRLYGAIRQDLGEAAQAKGGAAAEAWGRAVSHWRAREARLEAVRGVADSVHMESVLKGLISGVKDGGSAFRDVLAAVPEESRGPLRSLALWKLGATGSTRGAAGMEAETFDLPTFARNWRALKSSGGDKVLLPSNTAQGRELAAAYDRLARVSLAGEEGLYGPRAMLNPSGTAQAMMQQTDLLHEGLGTSLAYGPRGLWEVTARRAGLGALKRLAVHRQALLMTDPDFVRWAAELSDIVPPKPPATAIGRTFRAGAPLVRRLVTMAAGRNPAFQQAIQDYMEQWKAALDQQRQAAKDASAAAAGIPLQEGMPR